MYTEIAEVTVRAGVVDWIELELQLFRRTQAELGEEGQELRIEVRTGSLEEIELGIR
jgi:hypothetical protein